MIDLPHIKTIQKKWIERRPISHVEIGELLDFAFQLHLDTEQKPINDQKLQQLENALKEPFLAVDVQQIMSDTIPALIAEIRRLQKENAQYKALSAALPDVVQLEIK